MKGQMSDLFQTILHQFYKLHRLCKNKPAVEQKNQNHAMEVEKELKH